MKTFSFFAAVGLSAWLAQAETPTLESFCPHFPTNTPIVWKASTDQLPISFWIYRRLPVQPFPATLISNAICLAGLPEKSIPSPSTNDFFIWKEVPPNYPGPIPSQLEILPKSGTIGYTASHPEAVSSNIPPDEILIRHAQDYAIRLGIDSKQIAPQKPSYTFNTDDNGFAVSNQIIGRNVYLSRQLDGVVFMDPGEAGGNDGLWMQFGNQGSVRSFYYVWPALVHHELQPAASPEQIIACIRAFKTMTPPANDGDQYFQRVKSFAQAKKLTINRITPYYGEGIYGEVPTNDAPAEFLIPMAELEGVADFGGSNVTVKLYSPIVASEVARLLAKNEPEYEGRKLSEWLRDFDNPDHPEKAARAAEAMRHIGPAAVPFLVDQLSAAKLKQTKIDMEKWRGAQAQAPDGVEIPRPSDPRSEALAGFDALGSAAETALPALKGLLQENPPDPRVLYVVARIGPASVPLLSRCLTNGVSDGAKLIRAEAKICLEMLNARSELLYPKIPVGPDAPSFNRRISGFNLKIMAEALNQYKAENPDGLGDNLNASPTPKLPE